MAFPGVATPGYGNIGGALPFGDGGNPVAAAASANPGAIAGSYQQAYNSALQMNHANYNNILSGYQQALTQQTSAQQAIQAGYSNLYNDVIGKISSIGGARSEMINRESQQQLAKESQQLINRGLGNTTIQSAVDRGVQSDRNLAQLQLSDQLARQMGDYMSNLGLQGLNNQQRGLENSTGQVNRQLDFMNSVNAKYPDAGMYASLAQTAAQTEAMKQYPYYGGGAFASAGGNAGPKLGYTPAPYYSPSTGGGYGSSIGSGTGIPYWESSAMGLPAAGGAATPTAATYSAYSPQAAPAEAKGGPPAGYFAGYDKEPETGYGGGGDFG